MLPKFKSTAIATLTALSLALGAAAPAQALGKNERNFLKGVAATVIIGALINDAKAREAAPQPQPQPQRPIYRDDRYSGPQKGRYQDHRGYDNRQHDRGRVIGSGATAGSVSVYGTAAAQAFNSYSAPQRRAIQAQLRSYGYYRGGVDGAFGPGTYSAVVAYARDSGGARQLDSRAGSYGIYDSLLY